MDTFGRKICKKDWIISFLWWFAEATFFFIVPDVILSYFWATKWAKKSYNIVYSLLWAILWWILIYWLSKRNLIKKSYFLKIPWINNNIMKIAEKKTNEWIISMTKWSIQWIPYKLFAYYHWKKWTNFIKFVSISKIARLPRFIVSFYLSSMIWCILNILFKTTPKSIKKIVIMSWIIIYIFYFILVHKNYW